MLPVGLMDLPRGWFAEQQCGRYINNPAEGCSRVTIIMRYNRTRMQAVMF